MDLSLSDIGAVLGCSKAAASRLRAGKYERPGSELIQRYQALEAVVKPALDLLDDRQRRGARRTHR